MHHRSKLSLSGSLPLMCIPPWIVLLCQKRSHRNGHGWRANDGFGNGDRSNATYPNIVRLCGLGTSNDAKVKSGNMAVPQATTFRLCSQFIEKEGRGSKPQFGFNGLGELVYQRTYARYLREDTDDREQW